MLIGHIQLTQEGIILYDTDGSKQAELPAQDTLDLYEWIGQHMAELRQMTREQGTQGARETEGRGNGR